MRAELVNRRLIRLVLVTFLTGSLVAGCTSSSGPATSIGHATLTSGPLVITVKPTPTPLPAVPQIPSPTPTATPIYATEVASPTSTAPPVPAGYVWEGSMLSYSSRQYFSNGSPVNLCQTSWSMNLVFIVNPDNTVTGEGTAALSKPRTCSASSVMAPNVTDYTIKVSGSKDDAEFNLQLGVSSFKPDGTGEFGGFNELFVMPQCNPVPTRRTIVIPLSEATQATGALDFGDTMTGCGGSGDDVMKDKSNFNIRLVGSCADVSADRSDPEVAKLCQ